MPIRRRLLSNTRLLSLGLIAVGMAAVIIVAIFFRQGAFSVVAEGQGASIKLNFAENRVDLSQLLDKLVEEAGEGHDADAKRRLVSSILQAHHYYYVPSVEAVTAIREIGDTDAARDSARAMRTMLYDLAGPFARPATLLEARDDRFLLAIDDLFNRHPDNPIITKLWEMSLDLEGIFEPRDIRISVREDESLPSGVAATCLGSILLGKVGLIRIDDERGAAIGPRVERAKVCRATAEEAQERKPRVWLSPSDMSNLVGNRIARIGRNETSGVGGNESSATLQELHAILTPLPRNLVPESPGS
ncbi:MAG: hypothetical protein WCD75_15170 [Rhodoplanes sp.]